MTEQDGGMWAVVELMGHLQLAGKISYNDGMCGLWKLAIPDQDGDGFSTQMFSSQSVYRIRIVSEDIARAYAGQEMDVYPYDEPIITREQHEQILDRSRSEVRALRDRVQVLESRLAATRFPLPAGSILEYVDMEDESVEGGTGA